MKFVVGANLPPTWWSSWARQGYVVLTCGFDFSALPASSGVAGPSMLQIRALTRAG